MVCNNVFSSQVGGERQIYLVSKLSLNNNKCSGVENCKALKNAGLTPPPYYFQTMSTDTVDWDEGKINKNMARYFKAKPEKIKATKRKPDKFKNKDKGGESTEINNPKDFYLYKRKHLVQEITFPRRIRTSIANLYRSHKKKNEDAPLDKNEDIKNRDKKNKKRGNTCTCPEMKDKKKKVEFAILPNQDKVMKTGDEKLIKLKCKCRTSKKNKKIKDNKCACKEDKGKLKKQKYKCPCNPTEEKDKYTTFYRELFKKIEFDDIPPEGNKGLDYIPDTHAGKIKDGLLLDERCHKGPCAKAVKKKNYEFVCKCVEKKKKPQETECIDAICNVTSTSTVAKIRKKIIMLCHKYSHLIKEKNNVPDQEIHIDKQVCDAGLCRVAFDNKKENFTCKCVQKAKECTDDSCGLQAKHKSCLKPCYDLFKKSYQDRKKKYIASKSDALDQTGEPFFELRVDSIGLRPLNPKEIRAKVEELGNSQKKIKCICPSHDRTYRNFLQKTACPSGICERKYKDKKTNFKCKCPGNHGHICTDSTCEPDKKNIKWTMDNNNPLMEVKFSTKDMNIVNRDEVRNNIFDIKSQMNDVCSSGICREAAENDSNYSCNCTQKKLRVDVAECGDNIKKHHHLLWRRHLKSEIPHVYPCKSNMESRHEHVHGKWSRTRRKNNIHKRKALSIPSVVHDENKHSSTFLKCQKIFSSSFSALLKRVESRRHKFKRNGLNIPLTHKEVNKKGDGRILKGGNLEETDHVHQGHSLRHKQGAHTSTVKTKEKSVHKHKHVRSQKCMCYHTCECGLIKNKEKLRKQKLKKKLSKMSRSERIRHMRKKRKKSASHAHDSIRKRKEFLKEQKHFRKELKKKEKADKKHREKLMKIEKKELEAISQGREAEDTSCFADFCIGVLKSCVFIVKWVLIILFKIISDPKGSYTYVRLKMLDPIGTFERMYKVVSDAWRIKKLQMLKSISGSEKMTILSDTLQDTAVFQAFANKGKTPKEKRMIAQKNKQRKIRMAQRNTQAFRSCEHNLLHTLRKTPCLWVYHICPFFYPQCLGILALTRQLTDILLFMLAFIVWTPCIACCETCRAFCCCILCTN